MCHWIENQFNTERTYSIKSLFRRATLWLLPPWLLLTVEMQLFAMATQPKRSPPHPTPWQVIPLSFIMSMTVYLMRHDRFFFCIMPLVIAASGKNVRLEGDCNPHVIFTMLSMAKVHPLFGKHDKLKSSSRTWVVEGNHPWSYDALVAPALLV